MAVLDKAARGLEGVRVAAFETYARAADVVDMATARAAVLADEGDRRAGQATKLTVIDEHALAASAGDPGTAAEVEAEVAEDEVGDGASWQPSAG